MTQLYVSTLNGKRDLPETHTRNSGDPHDYFKGPDRLYHRRTFLNDTSIQRRDPPRDHILDSDSDLPPTDSYALFIVKVEKTLTRRLETSRDDDRQWRLTHGNDLHVTRKYF